MKHPECKNRHTRLSLLFACFILHSTFSIHDSIAAAAPAELVNISVRTQAGTGDAALIAGFVISGNGERPFLVRAVGPTLGAAPFNIPGVLLDPQVALFRNNSPFQENDDWGDDPALASASSRLGAFALRSGSKDAALLARVDAGVYTAVARGAGGATGDLLLEVYDARESIAGAPAISNLSLRVDLGPRATMVAGFVVGHGAPKRLLIRAIGPSLEKFGVENVLGNPRIRLFTGSTDVALNDDWIDAPNAESIADVSKTIGAFALGRDSADAAVLTSLQPGAYTLHVTSAAPDDQGIVLVELYSADPALAEPAPPPAAPAPGLPLITVYSPDDSASEAGDTGEIRFHRSGETTEPLTIAVAWSGSATAGTDYAALASAITFPAGVSETGVTITPLADSLFEPPESVVATVYPNPNYAPSAHASAGVLIEDAPYAGATGWRAEFFNNKTFSGEPALARVDAAIDFDWGEASPGSGVRENNFSARWTGVLVPPATADYTFIVSGDDTVRLWIDGEMALDRPYTWRETAVILPLEGGVPHLVRFELIEEWGNARAQLSWSGGGLGRHVVTEAAPFHSAAPTPTGIGRTVAIVGEPFVAQITATGAVAGYSAAGLPPGLALNPQSGVISGIPTSAGNHAIWIDTRGNGGTGSARVFLEIVAPGGMASREVYPESGDAAVPAGAAPVSGGTVSSLDRAGGGGPFLERIRGYITVPESGLHRFWLSASGPARFYFADSDEPGDKALRARVNEGTAARSWTTEAGQQSPPLALEAGRRHYFEIVHAQAGAAGHVSVGWIRPGQTGATPFEIVPGYALSPFENDTQLADGSTVYLASLRPAGIAQSGGFGVASIVLDPEETSARVSLRFGGLTSDPTNIHIYYGDAGAGADLPVRGLPRSTFEALPWTLAPVGGLSRADLVAAMKTGHLFVSIQTTDHPTGELRGHFGPAIGSASFEPPASPAGEISDTLDAADAARFLNQATYGATLPEIEHLRQIGMSAWFAGQAAAPQTRLLPYIQAVREERRRNDPNAGVWTDVLTESWWRAVVDGPDQLRQRMAFALSEILVVSEDSNLGGQIDALAVYYDMLAGHAFGNFHDLLREATLSPAMGVYLSMIRNEKPNPAAGVYPDENYAREVMQLFSIGLNKLHPDGTLVLDSHGLPIPTYAQESIVGLAHVFTGWAFWSDDPAYNYRWGEPNFHRPMKFYPEHHDEQPKRLLDAEVLPAGRAGPEELEHVIAMLFNHPNTGPFISRQLIQRLVTSNPSPAYVYRVAQAFADNGSGVRGDLGAVARAILTDPDARDREVAATQGFGKLREPLIRIAHLWRAFDATAAGGRFDFSWTRDRLGQEVLQSPTVFNFFQPDYITPGPAADAGLVAPEFQIATDGNLAHFINTMDWFTMRRVEWTDDPVLDITAAAALVSDPDALLDRLDLLLLGGSMTPELRASLRALMTGLPGWNDASERARCVIFTLITSPDYAVQK